jgi:hypothetical protein
MRLPPGEPHQNGRHGDRQLSAQYPGIVLHVFEVAAPTLDLPQLRDRTLDLAMIRVAGPPSAHRYGDDLDVEVLLNDETRIVVTSDGRNL